MRKASGKSIVDVGRLAGVSFATVSRVFRNDPHVAKETIRKVHKAAYKLGYVHYGKDQNPLIGVFMPELHESYFYTISSYTALTREILKRGWNFEIIHLSRMKMIKERFLSGAVNLYRGDDVSWNKNYLQPLITYRAHKPMLDNVYSIAEDGAHDMEECVKYLWDLGHRRIGLLLNHSAEEEESSMEQRRRAFLDSMNRRGADDPVKNIFFNRDGSLSSRIDRLLDHGVTALIAAGSFLGLQTYHELLARGLQIPRDISLITWEIPSISENLYPRLTAMKQNFEGWAVAACDLFETVWSGKKAEHSIYIPGRLIIRESCTMPIPDFRKTSTE